METMGFGSSTMPFRMTLGAVVVVVASITWACGGEEALAPITEQWVSKAWDTEDGLPDNSVTCIAQTPDGYLWLGTFGGLVRFDGIDFLVYTPANAPLPSPSVVNLHCDARG